MIGDQQINRESEREIEMRDAYSVPLDEMPGLGWRGDAQCLGRDPREYELDSIAYNKTDRQAIARELCDGCEVMRECATEALEPLARSTVRAGVWIPFTMTRGTTARVREALIDIALGEALPDDLTELLEPAQGASEYRTAAAPRLASAPPSLTPVGRPPRNGAGVASCAPLPASRGVGGRG